MAYYTDADGNQQHSEKSDLSLEETIEAIKKLSGGFETVHIIWTEGGYGETLWSFNLERLALVWDMLMQITQCEAVVPYRNDWREIVIFEVNKDCENFSQLEEMLRIMTGN